MTNQISDQHAHSTISFVLMRMSNHWSSSSHLLNNRCSST